jgi:hypothetical protein
LGLPVKGSLYLLVGMALIWAADAAGGQFFAQSAADSELYEATALDRGLSPRLRGDGTKYPGPDTRARTLVAQARPGSPPPEAGPPRSGDFTVRMSAVLKGTSSYDAVGPGKTLAGDDKPDGLFILSIQAQDKDITAIEIRNTDGAQSVWDTVPSSSHSPIGVATVGDPVRLLNRKDGSISIKVKDRTDLNLYVADNGTIQGGKTNYRISVTLSDGGVSWAPVQRAAQPSADRPSEPTAETSKVNFLGRFKGYWPRDAVGPYAALKPDGVADAVFDLDIEVAPKNFITGIEIGNIDGTGRTWSTTGAQDTWGLAVAYQTAPTAILNRPDGSVRVPIDGRAQFYLYVADPGDLSTTHHRMRIIVHLADGSSYQQPVRRLGTTTTVVPGLDEPPKAKGAVTCQFRGFMQDFVNTSNRPGKDGYQDGTFMLKIDVDDKKLAKVEISGSDGVVRWSSEGKAPAMFLGVALYPKMYTLVNEKGGLMQIPFSGRLRTLYLYAADNGMLSDLKTPLSVTVTFSDKSSLSTEVIK